MKKYSQIRPSGLTIVLWRKCPEADKKTEQGGSFRLLAQRAGYGVMNCTPNVGHNLTSEGAVYETFI
ncbi:hypothetical protein ECDEC2C_4781 [Escherichia coli DEC2C]|nr:hypothetical protein ECDEC1C_4806 [Escherichia coli DEC1C]EHU20639.1 hypothetical protein ECDEC1E_4860 [Escherichia coli DEC1E]EHU36593.1 hypothetical protein ECDEC2C_4781 [Escherichia coli DEC2C]